jgi:hypothetical protein
MSQGQPWHLRSAQLYLKARVGRRRWQPQGLQGLGGAWGAVWDTTESGAAQDLCPQEAGHGSRVASSGTLGSSMTWDTQVSGKEGPRCGPVCGCHPAWTEGPFLQE